jgi:hypothetical protein
MLVLDSDRAQVEDCGIKLMGDELLNPIFAVEKLPLTEIKPAVAANSLTTLDGKKIAFWRMVTIMVIVMETQPVAVDAIVELETEELKPAAALVMLMQFWLLLFSPLMV